MRKILKYFEYLRRIVFFHVKFGVAYLAFLCSGSKLEEEWIISERGDEARDNGYHLFRYIRKNHSTIKVSFILTKESVDLPKVEPYGNIIWFGSIAHYKALIRSTHLISTHVYGWAEYGKAAKFMMNFLPTKKIINIKHGIVSHNQNFSGNQIDLMTSVSRKEKDILTQRDTIDLPVKITGLCRFDNLTDISNKQEKIILIMPTFRTWLHDLSRMPNKDELFMKEDYYKYYNNLLNSTEILELCNEQDVKVYFYPHYRMQKYLHLFNIDQDKVILASKENYDIQELLKKSTLLITDYSSIYFDFAYMKKPIIYFQFDKQKFYESHYYEQSHFTIRNNGFGEVAENILEVKMKLTEIIANDFKMSQIYKDRVSNFFEYDDHENCKRVLDEILLLD